MSEVKEYLLSTNNFKEPKVVNGSEAICILIVRLILMEPGSRIDMPDAGIGLNSRYAYLMESDIQALELEIQDQVSMYLPDAREAEVQCRFNSTDNPAEDNKISIIIKIGDDIAEYDMEDYISANVSNNDNLKLSEL